MTDKLIRVTTALAVATVAAVIFYRHAHELVRSHGESGLTARLVPFTVDRLIWAGSAEVALPKPTLVESDAPASASSVHRVEIGQALSRSPKESGWPPANRAWLICR
jgi:hypothetical protein